VLVLPLTSGSEHVALDARQQVTRVLSDSIEGHGTLFTGVSPNEHRLILLEVLGTDLHTNGHAAQLPFVVLRAGFDALARIEVHTQTPGITALPVGEHGHGARRCIAPANRSESVLRPVMTGIAIQPSMKSR